MRFSSVISTMAALALAACVPSGHTPWVIAAGSPTAEGKAVDRVTLERTACFGTCPIYKVSVDERDILVFEGKRFVVEEGGSVSKRLPEGSFKKLTAISQDYQFSQFDAAYPNAVGDNCQRRVTDLPTIIVSVEAKRDAHQVSFYQGCLDVDGRARFNEMVAAMDAVMDIDDWIGPRDDFKLTPQ